MKISEEEEKHKTYEKEDEEKNDGLQRRCHSNALEGWTWRGVRRKRQRDDFEEEVLNEGGAQGEGVLDELGLVGE